MMKVKRISWDSTNTQYREAPGFEEQINAFFESEQLTKADIFSIQLENSDDYNYLAAMIFYDKKEL